MDKMIFSDGTKTKCSFCGVSSFGNAIIDLPDISLTEAAAIASDESKTAKMIYDNGAKRELNGYIVCESIDMIEENGIKAARISMRRKYEGE